MSDPRVVQVKSDSGSKTYTLLMRDSDGKHSCDCTGFVTKRNKLGGLSALGNPKTYCKHIKRQLSVPADPYATGEAW